ncbi:MAG: PVC-type heme-binding CxxCH protein [Aureliella sp.]
MVRTKKSLLLALPLFSLLILPAQTQQTAFAQRSSQQIPFALEDGDQVVLIGDALIEQEQYSGWLEVLLASSFAEHHVTFRNLGWSGDTPAGASRFGLSLLQAGREPADEGWKQLQKQIQETKPDVAVIGYGMASALEGGMSGLDQFAGQLSELGDFVRKVSPNVQLLFLSPLQTLEKSNDKQQVISAFTTVVRDIAKQQGAPFVDIRGACLKPELRKDPIHLNDDGYRELANFIGSSLSLGSLPKASPTLKQLRKTILRKNEWWFHRSRPANMAYVFGFRKREQGQNAVEIPQFDALIEEEERRIAKLRSLDIESPEEPSAPRLESKFAEFQSQPTPEFTVDEDWEITLWAENPLLNKPIHMNFDPQGRLWIASSEAYPMIEVGQSAPDRVLVLEDTNGDGKADASTVFADGLLIPTGIAPGDGGVYVAQSTDLLFLKDTDGDGKADSRTRVLSGFGTEDTHHNLHTLRWGPDGRLYMNQSVYTRTDTETPHGVVRLKAGGGFRYDTQTMQMDIFFRGLWNSWGHHFDAFGQSFLSDGAGFAGLGYTFPGATFNPVNGAPHILDLISPGRWPKFASLEIIQGPNYPSDWQGSIITCDFRANRVTRFSLTEQDAGFVTKQEADLVRTSAATFRPIDVKQGPDGALYIADWSNPIINHGEVDFRDPRRDRWHGRIWRLQWKGAKPSPVIDYAALDTNGLLAKLKRSDLYEHEQSRRVLIERHREKPAEVEGALAAFISSNEAPRNLLQALWLGQAIDQVDQSLLIRLLNADDPRVRAAACRVLGQMAAPHNQSNAKVAEAKALELLRERVVDSHPRVRLESICALASLGSSASLDVALNALQQPMDRFLQHALSIAAFNHPKAAIKAADESRDSLAVADEKIAFVLKAIEPAEARDFLGDRIRYNIVEPTGDGPWIELIAAAGGGAEIDYLWRKVTNGYFETQVEPRVLGALADAQRLRKLRPSTDLNNISLLLASKNSPTQRATVELITAWRLHSQTPSISRLAESVGTPAEIRRVAIQSLGALGGNQAIETLSALSQSTSTAPWLRSSATIALAKCSISDAAPLALNLLNTAATEESALAAWRGLLATKGFGKQFAKVAKTSLTNPSAIQAGLRASRDGGRNEPELLAALESLVKSEARTQYGPELAKELTQLVASADPHRGEAIYRRTELACATCHAIGGVGGKVGPDMTSLGASAPLDYLMESLFEPNAKIKENYHAVSVITEDDQILTGIELESTSQEFVLRNANDEIVRIPAADIIAKKPAQSLMPVGVVDRLDRKEQADLLAFLSLLGKPGEFDATKPGVARIVEIFAGTHRREQQGAEKILSGEMPGWKPTPCRVNGSISKETIIELTKQPVNIGLVNVYARTYVQSTEAGTAVFSSPGSTAFWVDGRPAMKMDAATSSFKAELSVGEHQVIVRFDARDLPTEFLLKSDDVAFIGIKE